MKLIGNILWVIFEGFWLALGWLLAGLLLCITVIGIPFGIQCFKIAGFVLFPFGKEINYGKGTGSFLLNIIWIIFGGLGLAIGSLMMGLLWCITIIGIPFGIQSIKLAKLSLMPFGSEIK
jgi:uncharacterized membrane protein YccF (DUF307 family)